MRGDPDRPATPDAYKKWRKSTYAVPGTRVIHPGMVDDWKSVSHPEFFGKNKADLGEHVDDVLAQPGAESEFAQVKLTQARRRRVRLSLARGAVGASSVRSPGGAATASSFDAAARRPNRRTTRSGRSRWASRSRAATSCRRSATRRASSSEKIP